MSKFLDESGLRYFWQQLQTMFGGKVDKVNGKGLSTEDYTTADQTKLAGIEAQANKTTVDNAMSSSSENPVQNKVVKAAIDAKPGSVITSVDPEDPSTTWTSDVFNTGYGNISTGEASHAEGDHTSSYGDAAHSEGYHTYADTLAAHAEGYYTFVDGQCSHAEGSGTSARSSNQHVEGRYNVEDTDDVFAHIIGNGTDGSHRSNAFAIDWDGLIYVGNSATGVNVATLAQTVSALPNPVGTVTSVGITAGTGVSVSNSPVTTSGSITVGLDMASSVTASGTKPVTGAGIYTAISAKASVTDIFGNGTEIPANADLHTYTTPGVYYSPGASRSETLDNTPVSDAGFRLVVKQINTNNGTRIEHELQSIGRSRRAKWYEYLGPGAASGDPDVWKEWAKDIASDSVASSVTSSNTDPVSSAAVYTALSGKQNTLVVGTNLDQNPTSSSDNPVTSGGVYTALSGKQATLVVGTNLDQNPTSSSNNPVTSGGTYTAIANARNAAKWERLGTKIEPGTQANPVDLDSVTYKSVGVYYIGSEANAKKIVNVPVQKAGRLEVLPLWDATAGSAGRLIQRFTTYTGGVPTVYIRGHNASGWGKWYEFAGTEIPTNPSPIY